jgi:hypothetical protein
LTVTGLENGTEYTFQLQAVNGVGTSERVTIGPVTPAGAPDAPVDVVAQAGASGTAIVTWSAPEFNGGAEVTEYVVAFADGDDIVTVSAGGALSAVVSDLIPGASYAFDVYAVNSHGRSAEPAISNVITLPNLSSSPDDPEVPVSQSAVPQKAETKAAVDSAAGQAFGSGVKAKDSPLLILSFGSKMSIVIELDGLTQSTAQWDSFDIQAEQLALRTSADGRATFTLKLSDELSIIGIGVMGLEPGQARLSITQASLMFNPLAGENGGALTGARFIVDLFGLPDGASLAALFSPASSTDISGAQFTFGSAAGPGEIKDPDGDVAGAVSVTKINIANTEFGDTTITFLVSAAWYERLVALGRSPVIAKLSDDGEVFYESAICARDVAGYTCRATFSGEAAGFSEFALVGVSAVPVAPVATPTPRPATPTPAPSPSVTVTPTPSAGATATPTPEATVAGSVETSPTPAPLPTPESFVPPVSEGGGVPFWVWIVGGIVAIAAFRAGLFGYSRVRSR